MRKVTLWMACAVLFSGLLFAAAWRQNSESPGTAAAPAGERFQLVPVGGVAMIFDSATGCAWVRVAADSAQPGDPPDLQDYLKVLGDHFEVAPFVPGYISYDSPGSVDAEDAEVKRVAALCDRARVHALEAATQH